MEDLSLHILDIAENAVRANAKNIIIEILEDDEKKQLIIKIKDDGCGMDQETLKKVQDPFFTTKNEKKYGLGISLFSQAAIQTGGDFKIDSKLGSGTTITAVFYLDHPDMKPMGKITDTIAALIVGNPTIRFVYDYKKGDYLYYFDSFKNKNK